MATHRLTDHELAVHVVEQAGAEAERIRSRGMKVGRKRNHADVVTEADLAAERIIVDTLRSHRPDDAIVGEEGSSYDGSSGRTWIIDPVDGTWNFLHRLDRWCSAVALVADGQPKVGAVHKPRAGSTYVGGIDLPATRNGAALPQLTDVPLNEGCVATYLHPPYFGTEVGDAWQRAIAGAATIRMLGSGSLDLVSVTRGQLAVYAQHSVPDWDWYPGVALVLSAGGAARKVHAAGVEWAVAGAPSSVAAVCEALLAG